MNNTSSMKPGGLDRSPAALAPAPAPLGAYRRVIAHDGLVWLSGMLPLRDGRPAWTGTLGDDCSVEDGIAAARLAAENAVAALYADLGSLAHLRVVRLGVYLRTTPTFTDHPRVADAASLRVRELLGARAEHTRLVFGVASLPGGMPVELEVVCMQSDRLGDEFADPHAASGATSPRSSSSPRACWQRSLSPPWGLPVGA